MKRSTFLIRTSSPRQRRACRAGRVEWISAETAIGLIVVAIVLVLAFSAGSKLYDAVFGTEDDRLMRTQFEAFHSAVSSALNAKSAYAIETSVLVQPQDSAFYIVGYDGGEKQHTLNIASGSSSVGVSINRPAKACGDAFETCVCLYGQGEMSKVFSQNKKDIEPVECYQYGKDVIFSLRLFATSVPFNPTKGYNQKAQTSSEFRLLSPYSDIRLHDPVSDADDYYKNLFIAQEFASPARYLFIERFTRTRLINGVPAKRTFIFVADGTDALDERSSVLRECPQSPATDADAAICSFELWNTVVSAGACAGSNQARCAFYPDKGYCRPACITSCYASLPLQMTQDINFTITAPCLCDQAVRYAGTCIVSPGGIERHQPPACAVGEITHPCECPGVGIKTEGFCVRAETGGQTTYEYRGADEAYGPLDSKGLTIVDVLRNLISSDISPPEDSPPGAQVIM